MHQTDSASRKVILASRSPYRRELLQRIIPDPETQPADIDETPLPEEAPETYVMRLSRAKAETVASEYPDGCLVIGSDQAAVLDGKILGKPGTAERAHQMLAAASGRSLHFHTGLHILETGNPINSQQALDRTRVDFRPLTHEEIERYIAAEPALDCAGGFRCEGLGIALFERIRSDDPTALIGLPMIATARLLREFGFDPLNP